MSFLPQQNSSVGLQGILQALALGGQPLGAISNAALPILQGLGAQQNAAARLSPWQMQNASAMTHNALNIPNQIMRRS